ncbi:MAG TPA: adenylate/guanylate cyclase domain-containing protein [Chthoniobacterales bacterium]|nr:adenylate/guanylate cyclase domain-containing protein [Chthoniobacterales bacterium]
MTTATEHRKLAAIMFTDMFGYSALSQRDDKLALELLEEHRQLLREIFPRFNGIEIKTIGDAFLVEFQSALEAAQCAIEIQRALAKRNHDVTAEKRIDLKIGIHIGDVVHRGGDVYGDGVNIASRIEPLADAGGICVSMDVERQIRNALEARFEKLAPVDLKNISVPMDLFRIVLPWEQRAPVVPKSEALPKLKSRRLAPAAIAFALVVMIGVGWWWTTRSRKIPGSSPTASRITSVAVLPFKNYSGDANQEYFADGITDLLTTELSGIGAITVKSHQSALKFKNSTKSSPEIGEELHVDGIVEGSVLRDGNEVTVNVQLIEARTDRHLWAKKFERDVTNILKMRNEVVEAIAHEIQAAISPAESFRLSSVRSVNSDALQEYLLGRQAWNQQNEKGLGEALEHFNRAKEVDPEFALAWAGLADVYWSVADANIPAREAGLKAKAAADRALQLDDSLAEAHTAEGAIAANDFRWADSEKEYHRAIELNPNYAIAHWQYGWLLIWLGRIDQAQAEMERAVELDPLSAVLTADVCVPYALKKDYDAAIAQCNKATELDSSFFLPHFGLGWIEFLRGNYPKAIAELRAAQALDTNPIIIGYLGFTYGRSGQKDKAVEAVNQLNELAQRRFVTPFCQAIVYLGLGEDNEAIDWLEKAYEERSTWIGWLKVQPMLDPLRSNPRFQALYQKMSFPP